MNKHLVDPTKIEDLQESIKPFLEALTVGAVATEKVMEDKSLNESAKRKLIEGISKACVEKLITVFGMELIKNAIRIRKKKFSP